MPNGQIRIILFKQQILWQQLTQSRQLYYICSFLSMNVYELKDRTDSNTSRMMIPAHQNPYEQAKPQASDNPYVLPDNYTPNNYNLPVERDIRTSYAADLNPLRSESSSMHCRSLFATLLLIAGEIAGPVFYITQPGSLTEGQLAGVCVGSYVLYLLVACICNDLLQYLSHISHGINFEDKYGEVRALIGRFHLTATCYHYERREHFREVTDSNGNKRMEAYTTTEKVVTHTATEYITPARTVDASGQSDRIRANKNIVFIHFLVSYRFNDDSSRIKFDYLYERFKNNNRRDVHQDYSFNYEVPGLVEKQAFYVGVLTCRYAAWFYVFGIFGLVWPYSLWMQRKVDRFNIAISKVLSL